MRSHFVLSQFPFSDVKRYFATEYGGAERCTSAASVGIPHCEVRRYCCVSNILDAVRYAFAETERVSFVENVATYQTFSRGESRYSTRDMTSVYCRLVVVIEAPSRGGDIVIKHHADRRVVLKPQLGMAFLLSNLTEYDITSVTGGRMVLAVMLADIPSMRARITTAGSVVFSNSDVIFETPSARDVCCVFRLVVDAQSKETVGEQLLYNGAWHDITHIIDSGERAITSSEDTLRVMCFTEHVPMSRCANHGEMLKFLAAIVPPYADADRSTNVYGGSPKMCTVYTVYTRLLGAAV